MRGSNNEFQRKSESLRGGWLKEKVVREITAKELRIKDYGVRVLANKLRTHCDLILQAFFLDRIGT